MNPGAYTAVLHDRSLPEALAIVRGMGLESPEIDSGGSLPAPHLTNWTNSRVSATQLPPCSRPRGGPKNPTTRGGW
jgi:hypothetical protein